MTSASAACKSFRDLQKCGVKITANHGGTLNCLLFVFFHGASQLLESQWRDYSAWAAWGKRKVETGKASQGAQLSLSSGQPRQSSPPTVTLRARGRPCLRPTLSPSGCGDISFHNLGKAGKSITSCIQISITKELA